MTSENRQEGPKQPFSAVNMHTRLIYTPKTRVNVSYARFKRAGKVSVKARYFGGTGVQPRFMKNSAFCCINCRKTVKLTDYSGRCDDCAWMISGNNPENDHYYDDYYEEDDYDGEADYCRICGNYEICDEAHHAEYELSKEMLQEQLENEATCLECEHSLIFDFHRMPDETVCVKHAIAICSNCVCVHTVMHDEYYSIIAIHRGYMFPSEARFRNLPITIDPDEIPF